MKRYCGAEHSGLGHNKYKFYLADEVDADKEKDKATIAELVDELEWYLSHDEVNQFERRFQTAKLIHKAKRIEGE